MTRHHRLPLAAALAGAALVLTVFTGQAGATSTQTVLVAPAAGMPALATSGTDGTIEQIRQLMQCGSTMFAVGRFTQISRNGTVFARNNAFSFDATTGAVSAWNPNVTGTVVNTVALSADCSTAYLGGDFTAVNGVTAKDIASVNALTGAVNTGFGRLANGQVGALLMTHNHLLTGGWFSGVNHSTRKYWVSLDPTTGADDGYLTLAVAGSYSYTDDGGKPAKTNPTRIYNYALSPDGSKLLVMGDFMTVGGAGRQQIFMADLGATTVTLDPWYSPEFNAYCATTEPFYLQDASWAPDSSRVYVVSTGFKPANGPGYKTLKPRAGLCDAVAAFPTTASGSLSHQWINYTGCDSLYSTAADASTVYIGGHERWASNPAGCDVAGPSAVTAPGEAGLSPTTGAVVFNPVRARGEGADDMVRTATGLWIASDNSGDFDVCGGQHGHLGLCFEPNS